MVDAYTTSTVPSIPQPLAMPSPSLKNKFSIRSLRAKFKSTPSTLEEAAHVVDWEKLHPKRSISEPFNPWDLSPSDPSTPASMGNWSPSLSPSTTSRASFPEKGLPTPSPPQPVPVPVVQPESYESTEDFDIPRRHLPDFAESNVVQATNELAVMKLTVPEVENGVQDGGMLPIVLRSSHPLINLSFRHRLRDCVHQRGRTLVVVAARPSSTFRRRCCNAAPDEKWNE